MSIGRSPCWWVCVGAAVVGLAGCGSSAEQAGSRPISTATTPSGATPISAASHQAIGPAAPTEPEVAGCARPVAELAAEPGIGGAEHAAIEALLTALARAPTAARCASASITITGRRTGAGPAPRTDSTCLAAGSYIEGLLGISSAAGPAASVTTTAVQRAARVAIDAIQSNRHDGMTCQEP